MMINKKILITGGFGHIGSQLAISLCGSNNVTIIDSELLNYSPQVLAGLPIIQKKCDVRNIEKLGHDFDFVFHLGEYSRVEQSLNEPTLVLNNNLGNIITVLDFCKKSGAKLIYSGSSTKFADNGEAAFTNPYAFSKKINSEIVEYYCSTCSMDYVIVYFNNVYGPGETGVGNYATVIEKFLQQENKKQALTVRLPGTQKRIFTHVHDTVNALEMAAMFGRGDDHIICANEAFSVLEVAELISSNIVFLPPSKANRQHGLLDNSKMRSLGWMPKRNLAAYIRDRLES